MWVNGLFCVTTFFWCILRGNTLLGSGLWCFGQISLQKNQQMYCKALVKTQREVYFFFMVFLVGPVRGLKLV